jgi:arylsulfatase A-like enzyme
MASTEKKKTLSRPKTMAILVLLFTVAWYVWHWPRTHWSPAPPIPAAGHSQNDQILNGGQNHISHVLLISIDTCRGDHFGCYGYSRNATPNIDALAEESTLFNHAVSPVPQTLPAHCSMLTGTTPLFHNVHSNENYKLHDSNITLAEILSENGFATAAVIGSFVLNRMFGLHQGFSLYDDEIAEDRREGGFHEERYADDVTDRGIRWLDDHGDKKFFLFLHYYDPHTPYRNHEQHEFHAVPQLSLPVDRYDSEIAFTDYHIGRVLDKLKKMKRYDSTLIVLTADHGESLGDHGENDHAYFVYHSTIHVPLIIKVPGQTKKNIVHEPAGLVDILPTICGFLNLTPPANIQGYNLSGLWKNAQPDQQERSYYSESYFATKYGAAPLQALVTRQYKYIHTSRPELYDLWDDPAEGNNVFSQESELAKQYQDQLIQIIEKTDRSDLDSSFNLDDQARKQLESLGYVGGKIDMSSQAQTGNDDPKDLLDYHNQYIAFTNHYYDQEYAEAKKLLQKLITQRPQFYDPLQADLTLVLATHENSKIRDVPIATSIGEHAVEASEYRDSYALYALSEAYGAAGRFERAIKLAKMAHKIAIDEKDIRRAKQVDNALARYMNKRPAINED